VLSLCEVELDQITQRQKRATAHPQDKLAREPQKRDVHQKFWCLATKAEACFGRGEFDQYQDARAAAANAAAADWMMASFGAQLGKLKNLLEKHGHLLDPPWQAQ
jgi:hypothetical protein